MSYWSHRYLLRDVWEYYTKDTDIIICQEAYPDYSFLKRESMVWQEIGDNRPWGSGIYSPKYAIRNFPFKTIFPGIITVAEVDIDSEFKPIVISIYGLMEKLNGKCHSISNLHRIFSDLAGILENRKTRDRIIIGGDFNASLQFDSKQRIKTHRVFFDRLKAWGLYNCFEGNSDFIETYRCARSKILWQNDYIFISEALVPMLKSCTVIDNTNVRKFSDHNIVQIKMER
jgi:exodeoxyribonuclease-3